MSKARWMLSAGAFVFAAPAFAQPVQDTTPTQESPTEEGAPQEPDETAGQEGDTIVVTAQGRAQRLQDVPLAVSAVGQEQLQNSGANDIRALQQLSPSLNVSSTGTEANGAARIRGIGTVGDNPGLESSVAVFIDGVYRSRSGIGLNELGEVDRIEVLRGPQGTLFGRNASAGLIHIITRRPDLNEFGGMAELTYGDYNMIRAQGAVTGPIGASGLGFRLDAVYLRRDGFYDVVNAAGGTEEDVNDRNRAYVRGQLLYEPDDALSVRLIGDYTWRDESCCGAAITSSIETFDPTPGVPGDFEISQPGRGGSPNGNRVIDILNSFGAVLPNLGDTYNRQIALTPGTTYRGETTDAGVSLQINYDFGNVELTSITAYRDYTSEAPGDIDYTSLDIWRRAGDGDSFRSFQTLTQEIRLNGTAFDGKLDWLIGGYFAQEDLTTRDNFQFGSQYGPFLACRLVSAVAASPALRNPAAPGCLSAAGRATLTGAFGAAAPIMLAGLDRLSTTINVGDNDANFFQESTNYALFTHNIFNITDEIALTIGLRYTSESKDLNATFNNNNTICPTQQAFFANFLPGGATPLPAALQPLAQGIVNATCLANNTSSLNNIVLNDSRDEDELTGTVVLSGEPSPSTLIYGSFSHGYKAGGFNLDRSALGQAIFAPTDPRQFGGRGAGFGSANLQFDPEVVDAFEVGFKLTRPGFLFNVAGFYQRFSSFQLNTFNGSSFIVQNIVGCSAELGASDEDLGPTANATGSCPVDAIKPGVTSMGVEVEAQFRPAEDFNITAGFVYASTKYADNLAGRDTGTPLDSALFLLPGSNLSNAPSLTGTMSFAYTPELGNSGLRGLVYLDGRLADSYNTGSDLFPEKRQESTLVVNGRIGIRGPEQRWSVEIWAQNLLDEEYQQIAFNTPTIGGNSVSQVRAGNGGGSPNFTTANQIFSAFLAEPRTFGVTGRFRF